MIDSVISSRCASRAAVQGKNCSSACHVSPAHDRSKSKTEPESERIEPTLVYGDLLSDDLTSAAATGDAHVRCRAEPQERRAAAVGARFFFELPLLIAARACAAEARKERERSPSEGESDRDGRGEGEGDSAGATSAVEDLPSGESLASTPTFASALVPLLMLPLMLLLLICSSLATPSPRTTATLFSGSEEDAPQTLRTTLSFAYAKMPRKTAAEPAQCARVKVLEKYAMESRSDTHFRRVSASDSVSALVWQVSIATPLKQKDLARGGKRRAGTAAEATEQRWNSPQRTQV